MQAFNDYYAANHTHMMELWRTVGAFRRQYNDMKAATEREMAFLGSEFNNVSRNMQAACLNINTYLRNLNAQNQVKAYWEFHDKCVEKCIRHNKDYVSLTCKIVK